MSGFIKFKLILIAFFCSGVLHAAIDFNSQNSAIKIGADATLVVEKAMQIGIGSLVKESRDTAVIGNGITFSNGVLQTADSKSILTASYNPNGYDDSILLAGNQSVNAEPGKVYQSVSVSGVSNLIEGQPTFNQNIVMQDSNTTLTLALQSKLNKNVVLNGGTLQLGDNLNLADNIILSGNGTVSFNGRQITFGGKDTNWTNSIYWNNANDMVLNSRVNLSGIWTFKGESHVSGNGNILDLSLGGTIHVAPNTTLHLRDIKIRGLGSRGAFVLDSDDSHIRLSDSQVEMDRNVTVTRGGLYVDGESTIYTKNWTLSFDQRGSLTVDGTCLWYDPLDQEDHIPSESLIQPTKDLDPNQKYITYLNDGIIREVVGGEVPGPIIWTGVDYLHRDLWLSPDLYAIVIDNKVLFGNSHSIHFSRTSDPIYSPLIDIYPGKSLTLLNIVFENFSPLHLGMNADSKITFSDQTTLELARDEDLNMTWTFIGNCVLRGKGHSLKLGPNGNIVIQKSDVRYSALLFDDIEIKGITGTNIRCLDNTGTVSFKNVKWMQDANFSFTIGRIDILGKLEMNGICTFAYQSTKSCKIWQNAQMYLSTGFTFSYAPLAANRNLIEMVDVTSQIFMDGATLVVTTTGLQLTKGTLFLDHRNYLYNYNGTGSPARSLSQATVFGDGLDTTNDLQIQVMPGASIETKAGILDYRNVAS